MAKPTERPELLSLLDGRKACWDLIASWPNVPRPPDWEVTDEGCETVCQRWASVVGLSRAEVRSLMPLLFANGFVSYDGAVDRATESYVRAQVADRLPRSMRARPAEATP